MRCNKINVNVFLDINGIQAKQSAISIVQTFINLRKIILIKFHANVNPDMSGILQINTV